jgi:hypothetical protein
MTANEPSTRLKQGMGRLWRAVLDWDQAINMDPIQITQENLERRVSKLERQQKAPPPKHVHSSGPDLIRFQKHRRLPHERFMKLKQRAMAGIRVS